MTLRFDLRLRLYFNQYVNELKIFGRALLNAELNLAWNDSQPFVVKAREDEHSAHISVGKRLTDII